MNPWVKEAMTVDEFEFTHNYKGFHSWNNMSPELEFCELAAGLAGMTPPNATIIETGMGQGYLTRRLIKTVVGTSRYLVVYETERAFEDQVTDAWLGIRGWKLVMGSPDDLSSVSLTILDSDMKERRKEFDLWVAEGYLGSMLLIHDTYQTSSEVRDWIRKSKIKGAYFGNPRGAWLGVHP